MDVEPITTWAANDGLQLKLAKWIRFASLFCILHRMDQSGRAPCRHEIGRNNVCRWWQFRLACRTREMCWSTWKNKLRENGGFVYLKWNSILEKPDRFDKDNTHQQQQGDLILSISLSPSLYLSKCTTLCHFIWSVRSLTMNGWLNAGKQVLDRHVMWFEGQDSPTFLIS